MGKNLCNPFSTPEEYAQFCREIQRRQDSRGIRPG